MPRIRRVVPYHVQPLPGDETAVRHEHAVHVLVVTPSELQGVETAVRLVHPVLGAVPWVGHVGVQDVVPREDDGVVGDAASHDESVPAERPLLAILRLVRGAGAPVLPVVGVAPEEHDLSHVVEEADELEPVGMTRIAYALGGLEEVEQIGLDVDGCACSRDEFPEIPERGRT